MKNSTDFVEANAQKEEARNKKDKLEKEIPKFNRQQKEWQDRKNKIESKRMVCIFEQLF